ncbi:hypothetical protein PM082_009348 [Marasmius tenuissimus]|nr:hypothetical protein PM082_009348 [Marasmius tenuissimus]
MGSVVTLSISTLSVLLLLYGIYIVVFGLAVHILLRRDPGGTSKLYLPCTVALFVLGTIFVVLEVWGYSLQASILFSGAADKNYPLAFKYLTQDDRKTAWNSAASIISTLMNSIADAMLIHRCYVIWNSNKLILYPLALVTIVLNSIDLGSIVALTIGLSDTSKSSKYRLYERASKVDLGAVIAIAAFQLLLALMTGARIWWITRQARLTMGRPTTTRYKAIVAIVIESGLLYAATLLGYVIQLRVLDSTAHGVIPFNPHVLVAMMSGLAPTTIIVRVAYRKSVDSVPQMISTLQFAPAKEDEEKSSTV